MTTMTLRGGFAIAALLVFGLTSADARGSGHGRSGGSSHSSGGGGHSGGSSRGSGGRVSASGAGQRTGTSSGPAVARPGSSTPPSSSAPATPGPGNTTSDGSQGGSTVQRPGRTGTPVGPAVPRATPGHPGQGGSIVLLPGGYFPWGYGGLAFGGYYGGFYDPWYGGYAPDPWYAPPSPAPYGVDDEGAVRLKVKPRDASVYVDGYYMGIVDDFDGVLQKMHLSAGPHHIEVRDPRYETLTFDVNVEPDQTVTYHGEMKKSGRQD